MINEFFPQYDNGTDSGLNHSIDLNRNRIPNPEQQLEKINNNVSVVSNFVSIKFNP